MVPAGRMMAVTPVCSHTLNARSIVLSGRGPCEDRSSGKRIGHFDGDTSKKAVTGDYLVVERSHMETVMVEVKSRFPLCKI